MGQKITPEMVIRMRELRDQGMSYDAVAEEVGCSDATVRGTFLNPLS